MVKLIGMLLIISGIVSLIIGAALDTGYGNKPQLTGNVVANILTQKPIHAGFFDYLEATLVSYSIISFLVGAIFVFRFSKYI